MQKRVREATWPLVVFLLAGATACGESVSGVDQGDFMPPGYRGADSGSDENTPNDDGANSNPTPEQEVESSYESPIATGRFVWIANPLSGRVAYVDAATFEVRTVEAGNRPRFMAALPDSGGDAAIVINELSSDASILRADDQGEVSTTTVEIADGANGWAVSRGGKWAIAWTHAALHANPDPVQGFQDITVVALTKGSEKATRLTVGYRPVAVSFSNDETRAYAVTQDGVSVIDLSQEQGPQSSKTVPISTDPLEDPGTRDVSITPDGAFALVRRDGSSQVGLVSLTDGTISEVQLSGACTDLDLSADGTRALAAIREQGQIAILPIPAIATAPNQFEVVSVSDATAGSIAIAANAPLAFVYTNAIQEERMAALSFGSSPATVQTLRLHAPILSVFPSNGGESAIVIHQPIVGAAGAFSALSLTPPLPAKIVETGAPISAVALTPSGSRAVVTARDDANEIYGAYLVRSQSQQVDKYSLGSPPIAVGAVEEAQRAYVAQEHPEGRLTFIDFDTGLARTLTGFELATRVIDGSNP